LKKAHSQYLNKPLEEAWRYFANMLSEYALFKPKDVAQSMFGGDFYSEGFTAFRNNKVPRKEDIQWLIDFSKNIKL